MDYASLLILILRMYPHLHAVEAAQIAYVHVAWHETNEIRDGNETACKAQIRKIVGE